MFLLSCTIHDVARLAGVSTATVSRVTSGAANVREDTRRRVLEAAKVLDYQPNALARGLHSGSTNTVGILLPDISDAFHIEIYQGISRVLNKHGIIPFMCNTEENIETEKVMINALLERRVDGFIFIGARNPGIANNNHIRDLAEKHHVMLINDQLYSANVYSVMTDEIQGAYNAVSYMIQQGHKKILHITSSNQFTSYKNKQTGYELALSDHDLPLRSNMILYDFPHSAAGKRVMDQFFASGWDHEVTAIFCANDMIAMGVQKSLLEKGYSIPDDFSVVGFGGSSFSENLFPSLSTVSQTPFILGETAGNTMLRVITGDEDVPLKQLLQPKLVVRASMGAAREHTI